MGRPAQLTARPGAHSTHGPHFGKSAKHRMRTSFFCLAFLAMLWFSAPWPARAQPAMPPAPGSFSAHLHGYFQFSLGGFGSSLNETGAGLGPVLAVPELHLRPGIDAMSGNNIAYGARAELLSPYSSQGGGKTGKTGASASSVRAIALNRAYGYIGTASLGTLRLGQTDSAFTLLQTGVIEAFGDGGQWTLQGGAAAALPRGAAPVSTIIYADQPALYATPKLVYLSPDFNGVSFVAGFEPNANGIKQGYAPGAAGTPVSPAAYPPAQPGNAGYRRKNTVDAAVRYRQTTDALFYKLSIGVLHGTPAQNPAAGLHLSYNPLNVYQAGAQVSYAGLTLGANIKAGQVEDGYALQPKGARDALSYILGATYQIGPVILGGSYFNAQTAGAYFPGNTGHVARTLSEYGAAVGGNYIFNDHLSLFTQYMYGHRHQPGNPELTNGNAQVQLIMTGAAYSW